MSDIRDFKNIADEVMRDINVTEPMKDEVLKRCASKRRTHIPGLRLAAVAACGVLVVGILHLSGTLMPGARVPGIQQPNIQQQQPDVRQPGIYSVPDDPSGSMPGQPEVKIFSQPTDPGEWSPGSLEEARSSFGEGFLAPTYIPEGFESADISALGPDTGNADRVILNYNHADERFFVILEEKSTNPEEFPGFETVDINGITGYMKSSKQDSAGDGAISSNPRREDAGGREAGVANAAASPNNVVDTVDVRWFKDGVQYSVSGMLTQEEAVKIARSMV